MKRREVQAIFLHRKTVCANILKIRIAGVRLTQSLHAVKYVTYWLLLLRMRGKRILLSSLFYELGLILTTAIKLILKPTDAKIPYCAVKRFVFCLLFYDRIFIFRVGTSLRKISFWYFLSWFLCRNRLGFFLPWYESMRIRTYHIFCCCCNQTLYRRQWRRYIHAIEL